jgi:uncharacterized RDD family membrane protein YckC
MARIAATSAAPHTQETRMSYAPYETGQAHAPEAVVSPRAGFWIRFGAAIVDGVILAIIQLVLILAIGNAGQLLSIVIGLGYYIYLEGSGSGQTVGKRVAGIRVISAVNGGPIGYGAATGRYFARILSAIPLLLGYLWMLWDGNKQTWHDKLSGSVVVPVDAYPVGKWPNG